MFETLTDQRVFGAKVVTALNWLFLVIIGATASAVGGAWLQLALAGLAVAGFASLVLMLNPKGEAGRLCASVALMAQVSLLVAALGGHAWQVDMHMAYFAALAVLTIFCDWRAILAGAATVALHHLALNFLLPAAVFPGGGDFWRVVVHAVILVTEAALLMWVSGNISAMFTASGEALARAEAARAEVIQAQTAEAAAREAEQNAATERAALQQRVAAEQAEVVSALATGLARLAKGDLAAQIEMQFPDEYIQLKSDFNDALKQLQSAMTVVVGNVDSIKTSAGEIGQAANDLSRRTEKQAASLEETAAALDEITATVQRSAESARSADKAATLTRQKAEKGGAVVREAISAMGEIEQSARKISQIIGVIDEIAFQTNLLALNAGVEAARAGDTGKGFAVVAQEVRALAQRAAQAAREIKVLIDGSSAQVEMGASLVNRTGEELNGIVLQVGEVSALVSEMASSAQEQSAGIAQVNGAVNDMDRVTQQNAAMVEQSNAATQALAKEAATLAALVGQFKLDERPSPRGGVRSAA